MRTSILRPRMRRRGAVILAFSLTMTLIAAFGATLMARTLLDQSRINERRRELWRAFLHAEAGIAQVQHWAANPADLHAGPFAFCLQYLRRPRPPAPIPISLPLSRRRRLITESMLDTMDLTGFTTESGWYLGRIEQIELLPIDAGRRSPAVQDNFFKIVALGSAHKGIQRLGHRLRPPQPILFDNEDDPGPGSIQLPAPLISLADAERLRQRPHPLGRGMVEERISSRSTAPRWTMP
jgi:hypothetical protein